MKKEKIFWGMFFIVAAIFVIVSRLGILPDVNLFSLFFTILLAAVFIKSIFTLEFTGIFFSLAFLGIIYDEELGITAITPWTILVAALFLSIGFYMIFKGRKHRFATYEHHNIAEEDFATFNEEDGSQFSFGTNFGGSIKYVNSEDFQAANLDCSFGAMKIYFDNAKIQRGNAVVNINAAFCGVELFVPKEWVVVNNMKVSLAGVDEKNQKNNIGGGPTLTLNGSISFAGVTIIYV